MRIHIVTATDKYTGYCSVGGCAIFSEKENAIKYMEYIEKSKIDWEYAILSKTIDNSDMLEEINTDNN